MFDQLENHDPQSARHTETAPGPRQQGSELALLRAALHQIDYGMVVLDTTTAEVRYANCQARAALEGQTDAAGKRHYCTGLRLANGHLVACRDAHKEQLRGVLQRSKTGLRGFLSLAAGEPGSSVAVVPLMLPVDRGAAPAGRYTANDHPASHALLIFAKLQLCDDSTMAMFALDNGLTNAESQVLAQICKGSRPSDIASRQGVQISTVRTQLRSIRTKTGSDTIRALVGKVSILPPTTRQWSTSGRA
jgi:DNA-binding CsgD family transcriptional regulator